MRFELSRETRKDPTHSLWIIKEAEAEINKIFEKLESEILKTVKIVFRNKTSETFQNIHSGALKLAPAITSKIKASDKDFKKVTATAIPTASRAGGEFAEIQLGGTYEERADHWETLQLLIQNSDTEFSGMGADLSNKINQLVADGVLNESSFGDMQDALIKQFGISRNRAITIIQTEIMNAVNEAAKFRYKVRGVKDVEWVTVSDDPWPCKTCAPLDGQIFPIDDAPNCPIHPRCRCTIVPAIVKGKKKKRESREKKKRESREDLKKKISDLGKKDEHRYPNLIRFWNARNHSQIGRWDMFDSKDLSDEFVQLIADTLLEIKNGLLDPLDIPFLRGMIQEYRDGIHGSMGDGILSLTEDYLKKLDLELLNGEEIIPSNWKRGDPEEDRPFNSGEYFASPEDRAKALIYHEMGHHIHQLYDVREDIDYLSPPLEDRIKDARDKDHTVPATKYGEKNAKEWFADNYALYKMGRDDLVSPEANTLFEELGI